MIVVEEMAHQTVTLALCKDLDRFVLCFIITCRDDFVIPNGKTARRDKRGFSFTESITPQWQKLDDLQFI